MEVWLGISKSPKDSLRKVVEMTKKALGLDQFEGSSYALLGSVSILQRDWEKGISIQQRAIEIEPNGAESHALLGYGLRYADRIEEAINVLKKAIRLNPIAPSWYLYNLAASYCSIGQYEKAIEWAKKAVQSPDSNIFSHIILTECYGMAGRKEEAKAEAKKVLKVDPNFSLDRFAKTVPYKNMDTKKRIVDALREAGLK
jgi:tetratricopeptide (TPR) repeat protein